MNSVPSTGLSQHEMPWHRGTGYSLSEFKVWWICLLACASLMSLLTVHTTGLASNMHLFRVICFCHFLWFAQNRKIRGTLIQEEFTAWEAQAWDHKGQVSPLRVAFCSPGHSYGRWKEDYTDVETMQELNEIPCLKSGSFLPYCSVRLKLRQFITAITMSCLAFCQGLPHV